MQDYLKCFGKFLQFTGHLCLDESGNLNITYSVSKVAVKSGFSVDGGGGVPITLGSVEVMVGGCPSSAGKWAPPSMEAFLSDPAGGGGVAMISHPRSSANFVGLSTLLN